MTVSASPDPLFDADFLARVQQFSLSVAQAGKGGRLADQRSNARGQGIDFADFKPYVAGDDLRSIDWNIYRRLGKVFVRVFEERQDLPVYILADISDSMFAGEAPRSRAALQATLALAAVALMQQDSVALFPFAETTIVQSRGLSGRHAIIRVAQILSEWRGAGRTALADAAERLAAMKLRRGLIVVVSDFFDDGGLDRVLPALALLDHRLLLVQITRAEDADPTFDPAIAGDLLLEDSESGEQAEVTITPALIDAYRSAYRVFSERLTGFAIDRGAALVRIDAAHDVVDQLAAIFATGRLAL